MTDRHRAATRSVHKTQHRGQSSDGEQDVLLPRRRSQSVKKRDASWDKKWSDRQQTEEFRLRRPWTMPGKLNTDFWENDRYSCEGENIPLIRYVIYHRCLGCYLKILLDDISGQSLMCQLLIVHAIMALLWQKN